MPEGNLSHRPLPAEENLGPGYLVRLRPAVRLNIEVKKQQPRNSRAVQGQSKPGELLAEQKEVLVKPKGRRVLPARARARKQVQVGAQVVKRRLSRRDLDRLPVRERAAGNRNITSSSYVKRKLDNQQVAAEVRAAHKNKLNSNRSSYARRKHLDNPKVAVVAEEAKPITRGNRLSNNNWLSNNKLSSKKSVSSSNWLGSNSWHSSNNSLGSSNNNSAARRATQPQFPRVIDSTAASDFQQR